MAAVPPQGGRKHPQQEFLQVDTSNILFIVGGAFAGLEKVIQNRTQKGGMGFTSEVRAKDAKPKGVDAHVHDPVAKGDCLACHQSHASPRAALVSRPPQQLCTGCHAQVATEAAQAHGHAPAAKGDCTSCHDQIGRAHV